MESVKIVYDELQEGTYRFLDGFFGTAGVRVCGHIPGRKDSAGMCDACIYIMGDADQTQKITAEEPKNGNKMGIVRIAPIMGKGTYKLSYNADNDNTYESGIQIDYDSRYMDYRGKYLMDCLDALWNVQQERTEQIYNDFEVLRAFVDVYVKYGLFLHLNTYTVLCDDEWIVQDAQDAFACAYKEFREIRKNLLESRYSSYIRLNIAMWINETCRLLGQRLIFDTKKCMDALDQVLGKCPVFFNIYYLKARLSEIDPRYDNLSEAYYQKVLDVMPSGSLYYRLGHYYEKVQRNKGMAIRKYHQAYDTDHYEYRAVYKLAQAKKDNGKYIESASLCRDICNILQTKAWANCLHPKEQEYLVKAYDMLIKIYGSLYKDQSEYRNAMQNRQEVLGSIQGENRMYDLVFGDKKSFYAEKIYHWLSGDKTDN